MELIAITTPYFYAGEAAAICQALDERGFSRVHIRKPGASEVSMRELLERIPSRLRPRLSLHDYHELAMELGIGGVHLNGRNPAPPAGWKWLVSRSCHSLGEVTEASPEVDYTFLSPVFPSISKPGYKASFTLDDLRGRLPEHVFALGGVTPEKLHALEEAGFAGAAMLGSAWRRKLDMQAFRLQFITHGETADEVAQGAMDAAAGGCRWIQIRMKGAPVEEAERMALRLAPLREAGVTLLVDDHVELAARLHCIDGVHVGKNDMPVAEARAMLGPEKILGATAYTFDDLKKTATDGADYVGLGPFRFTTTKKNLSPVLGTQGYTDIMECCRRECIGIPVVAIGGITEADVDSVMATGVNGIAVSGAILRAADPALATRQLIEKLTAYRI